jgi:Fic family protein
MTRPSWIWNSPTWPMLTYDRVRLEEPANRARVALAHLCGKAEAIGALELTLVEREVWSGEAVATAAIEGEKLELATVRSSVGRRLGITGDFVARVPRNVEGLLDVMEDAAGRFEDGLSHEILWQWQGALFPEGRSGLRAIETGRYRTGDDPMQIASGPVGRETVHYVAPPSAAVRAEMHAFLSWFNDSRGALDGILRAGLAHVWFESVHPFEDGNGRVGRAIVDRALAQESGKPTRLHSIAAEMHRRQHAYYDALNTAQRGSGDVTAWLEWFVGGLTESCVAVSALIDESLTRARFWSEHRATALNVRQRKALNKLLEAGPGRFEGGLTQRKYAALTGSATATATRDLADLLEKGLLVRGAAAGRSTHYNLAIPGWEWQPLRGARARKAGSPTAS